MTPPVRGASPGRVVVIGGGIIGLATAYQLLRADPGRDVVVLEKETAVGRHQTGNNSGVLHAGLYYRPGSLKARLATAGIRSMRMFCEEHGIAHETCGKLVVATAPEELPRLRTLLERGRQNGLAGLRWVDGDEIRAREPYAAGLAAVLVPEEGIVDFAAVAATMARQITALGGRVITGAEVRGLRRADGGWVADTTVGEQTARHVVNCGGLHADRIARLAGERTPVRIVPFRGEYHTLVPDRRFLVKHLIYPVPDPAFPFLGVHLTRTIDGEVEAGPNAVLALSREGYRRRDLRIRDLVEALAFPGLWRFLARYPGVSWSEIRRSFSTELFAAALRRLVPEIRAADLRPAAAGVRAQAMLPTGELVQDFLILERPNMLHVLNAPSPGATASLAIGQELARLVRTRAA